MSRNDRLFFFEKSEDWNAVLGEIQKEFQRQANSARTHGRNGDSIKCCQATTWCDALEWVSNLPKKLLAKEK